MKMRLSCSLSPSQHSACLEAGWCARHRINYRFKLLFEFHITCSLPFLNLNNIFAARRPKMNDEKIVRNAKKIAGPEKIFLEFLIESYEYAEEFLNY